METESQALVFVILYVSVRTSNCLNTADQYPFHRLSLLLSGVVVGTVSAGPCIYNRQVSV